MVVVVVLSGGKRKDAKKKKKSPMKASSDELETGTEYRAKRLLLEVSSDNSRCPRLPPSEHRCARTPTCVLMECFGSCGLEYSSHAFLLFIEPSVSLFFFLFLKFFWFFKTAFLCVAQAVLELTL